MTTSDNAIEVDGLGKRYRLGEDLSGRRLLSALGIGAARGKVEELWALRDVSFKVARGEAIGIIGRNGAGKSTLLKVLSRITPPTEGRAVVRGRMSSLLEVGTGFHPELTGRENIFLNGAIIGMSKREIERKFDQIVAFSGVERFIDTPVKRYSSGMYVRLAFGIAAHLEPDILVVDEVLAVGDAAFQRKSLQTLDRMAGEHHRTVLFVSHNLQAVRAFCKRAILLEAGRVAMDGGVDKVVTAYLRSTSRLEDLSQANLRDRDDRTSGEVRFIRIEACGADGRPRWNFQTGEDVSLRFGYEVLKSVSDLALYVSLLDPTTQATLTSIRAPVPLADLPAGLSGTIELVLPKLRLRPGEYGLYIFIGTAAGERFYDVIDRNVDLPMITVDSNDADLYARQGYFSLDYRISVAAAGAPKRAAS
jgi:homopolymeric O-antigen transport system ATP-binding protein